GNGRVYFGGLGRRIGGGKLFRRLVLQVWPGSFNAGTAPVILELAVSPLPDKFGAGVANQSRVIEIPHAAGRGIGLLLVALVKNAVTRWLVTGNQGSLPAGFFLFGFLPLHGNVAVHAAVQSCGIQAG